VQYTTKLQDVVYYRITRCRILEVYFSVARCIKLERYKIKYTSAFQDVVSGCIKCLELLSRHPEYTAALGDVYYRVSRCIILEVYFSVTR